MKFVYGEAIVTFDIDEEYIAYVEVKGSYNKDSATKALKALLELYPYINWKCYPTHPAMRRVLSKVGGVEDINPNQI